MADIFVDSSEPDDSGDGSEESPYKYINPHLDELSAGETMYLRGGTTPGNRRDYNEIISITSGNGCVSGTSGNPITITNYPDEYVRVHSTTTSPLFTISLDYWILAGQYFGIFFGTPFFELDRQDVGSNGYAVDINAGDYNVLRALHVHNGDYNPALIRLRNASNNQIAHCKIHDNAPEPGIDHHGVYITSTDSGTPADDNIIEYCEIYDCCGDCIQLQIAGTGTIADTIIRFNDLYTTAGIAEACENAVDDKSGSATQIYGNDMHGFRDCDGSVGGSGSDGQAMVIHTDALNTIIYYNNIYDISGAAIVASVDGVDFHHNVIYDLVYEASIGEKSILYVTSSADSVKFHNNTVVGSYGGYGNSYRSLSGTTVSLKNNIFYDCENINDAGSTTYDYNCWYSCTQTLSGGNDITSDPLFVSVSGDDYHLQSNSPCIDEGDDLGYEYEGPDPDMGAFEFVGIRPWQHDKVIRRVELPSYFRQL